MKNAIVISLGIFLSSTCFGQALKFKEMITVSLADNAKDFPVMYTQKKAVKKINVTYDVSGDTISYQIEKVPVFDKRAIIDTTTAKANKISDYSLSAEIEPKGKYLMVHFYPIKKGEPNAATVNQFFDTHQFGIELNPRTSLAFPYRRFHAGAMTLPLKIYMGTRASENGNNISSDANVGLYFGTLFGHKRYLKLPSEKEYRVYDHGWSLNAIAGLNKLDITDKNTLDSTSFQGSLVSSSLGVSLGWHYKVFAIFIASGFDIPLSDKADDWQFKGKPWIGFGAGFEIL